MSRRPDPVDLERARGRAKAQLPITFAAFLAIIALGLPLPRRFVALLPAVVAVVLCIRYLRSLRANERRYRMLPIITIGFMTLVGGLLAIQAVFYPQLSQYEDCLRTAQTQTARAECDLGTVSPLGSLLEQR